MEYYKFCANVKNTMKHMDGRSDGMTKIQNIIEP